MPNYKIIDEKLNGLENLINEKFKQNEEAHMRIIEQTTRTNGRICKVEAWKNKMAGALIFSNIIIIPILLWMFFNYLEK